MTSHINHNKQQTLLALYNGRKTVAVLQYYHYVYYTCYYHSVTHMIYVTDRLVLVSNLNAVCSSWEVQQLNSLIHTSSLVKLGSDFSCSVEEASDAIFSSSTRHSSCTCFYRQPHTHTHTRPFNGPLSGTTRVSRYQIGKTNLDFTGARDSEWQRHQLGMCKSAPRSRQITTPAHHQQQNYTNHQKFETILTTQIKTMLFVCVFQHILVL